MKRYIFSLTILLCGWTMTFAQAIVSTDSTTINSDTLYLNADTTIIIFTACAPVCSSIARAYNKDGKMLGQMHCPIPNAVFPEAYVENNRLCWRDNIDALQDEEEKSQKSTLKN